MVSSSSSPNVDPVAKPPIPPISGLVTSETKPANMLSVSLPFPAKSSMISPVISAEAVALFICPLYNLVVASSILSSKALI